MHQHVYVMPSVCMHTHTGMLNNTYMYSMEVNVYVGMSLLIVLFIVT